MRPSATSGASRSDGTSPMALSPRAIAATRSASASMQWTRLPASAKATASGRPT
jgi:hypothetical protein